MFKYTEEEGCRCRYFHVCEKCTEVEKCKVEKCAKDTRPVDYTNPMTTDDNLIFIEAPEDRKPYVPSWPTYYYTK